MPFGRPTRGNKKKRKRLKDIQPFEVALVPRGANKSSFVVLKEDGSMKLDLKKLTDMHASLGRIVTVCKSGTPAAETVDALHQDLQLISNTLSTMVAPVTDVSNLREQVTEITGLVDDLSGSTYDLNVQDQIDALQEKVKLLVNQLDSAPAQEAEEQTDAQVDAANDKQQAVTTDVESVETEVVVAPEQADASATADTGSSGATDTDSEPADAQQAATTDDAAASQENTEGASVDTSADDSATEPVASQETVTKADLLEMGKTIGETIKEAFAGLTTTLKSANTGRPQLLYPAGNQDGVGVRNQSNTGDENDESHWGNIYNLNAD